MSRRYGKFFLIDKEKYPGGERGVVVGDEGGLKTSMNIAIGMIEREKRRTEILYRS